MCSTGNTGALWIQCRRVDKQPAVPRIAVKWDPCHFKGIPFISNKKIVNPVFSLSSMVLKPWISRVHRTFQVQLEAIQFAHKPPKWLRGYLHGFKSWMLQIQGLSTLITGFVLQTEKFPVIEIYYQSDWDSLSRILEQSSFGSFFASHSILLKLGISSPATLAEYPKLIEGVFFGMKPCLNW